MWWRKIIHVQLGWIWLPLSRLSWTSWCHQCNGRRYRQCCSDSMWRWSYSSSPSLSTQIFRYFLLLKLIKTTNRDILLEWTSKISFLFANSYSLSGTVGHHHGDTGRPVDFPIEKLDVSASGDIVASTSHDQRVKFWNIAYLEKMEYQKTQKPYFQPKKMGKGTRIRRKDAKMQQAREIEYQLPSSKRTNRKEFFKELD